MISWPYIHKVSCKYSHVYQSYSNFEFSVAAILKIQNGGRYSSQITCLHFLYDKKLSIHKISCFYDNLNNLATNRSTIREELPTPLQSIFRFDRNTHAYNTRLHDNKYRIESKRWRTIVASQNILYQGPKIWNDIPLKYYFKKNDHDAGYVVSVSCFTTRLVKYLCSSYDT